MPAFVCSVVFVLAEFWDISLYHYNYISVFMIIMRL